MKHTWIPGTTISALIIARHRLDELLKSLLISSLLTFGEHQGHVGTRRPASRPWNDRMKADERRRRRDECMRGLYVVDQRRMHGKME